MAVGDGLQGCLEVGEGLDAVDLAGLDQRSDATPSDAAFVMACEECILALEGNRTDQIYDPIGADLDATVRQEGLQPVRMVANMAKLLAEPGLDGDPAASTLQ